MGNALIVCAHEKDIQKNQSDDLNRAIVKEKGKCEQRNLCEKKKNKKKIEFRVLH